MGAGPDLAQIRGVRAPSPAPGLNFPRGAEHLREVPETYAIAEHTDEPNMSDGLENDGPKLLPANVRAVKK